MLGSHGAVDCSHVAATGGRRTIRGPAVTDTEDCCAVFRRYPGIL